MKSISYQRFSKWLPLCAAVAFALSPLSLWAVGLIRLTLAAPLTILTFPVSIFLYFFWPIYKEMEELQRGFRSLPKPVPPSRPKPVWQCFPPDIFVHIGRASCGAIRHGDHIETFERKPSTRERQTAYNYIIGMGGTEEEAKHFVATITANQGPMAAANAMEAKTGIPAAKFLDAIAKHGWPE